MGLLGAVRAALGVEHIQAVGHGVDDGEDVLGGGFLAAGEGDDEGALADTGHGAAQAALGGDAHGFCAHGLGDAGGGPLENFHGRLGGNIPGGEAGAAGGQHQGDLLFVGTLDQFIFNHLPVIRDDGGIGHLEALFGEDPDQVGAGGILSLAKVALVGNGDHCCGIHGHSSLK